MIGKLFKKKESNDSKVSKEKTKTFFRNLMVYISLIVAYLVTIVLDVIFRRIDEDYAVRKMSQSNFIIPQIIFLIASLILLLVGHYSYKNFKKIQNDLTTKYNLTGVDMYRFPYFRKRIEKIKTFIKKLLGKINLFRFSFFRKKKEKKEKKKTFREKLLGKHIILLVLIISSAIMIIYLISHLINLPAYFPDKAISYGAETVFLLAYIPSIIIAFMFSRLFYLIVVFYCNLCKYVEIESLNLHPLYKDKTGGFGKSQNLLVFATFAVSVVSFSLIFINVLTYLIIRLAFMEEQTIPGEFLAAGIAFTFIPIVFFIFVMVIPLLKIRSKVSKFKRLKINSIIDEKSKVIEKGIQDKEKRVKEETIKELKSYDYYLDYYKALSPWPRFFKTLSVIITTISAVISFIISLPGVSDWIESLIFPS